MKKAIPLLLCMSVAVLLSNIVLAQERETASEAVAHMRVGWNLGNTLDSHSGDTTSMWIERWTRCTPSDYETAWGQPVTKPELMTMFAEGGFNAIRVPVTWYPHISDDGSTVDATWMKRVHEVVDYVIDAGMYCILNVHHDTGSANTVWIKAEGATYEKVHERYANLWTNIANEFKDYDEHLLFEAYNEMLDIYNSWCYPSLALSSYNAAVAADAYAALNNYCQTFVDAVRATGGNNTYRNLVLCTYAGASSEGSWNSHLIDPLTEINYPNDVEEGHIVYEVHAYPTLQGTVSSMINTTKQTFEKIKTNLMSKGSGAPVIIGELGTADADDYEVNNAFMLDFMQQYVALAKEYGIGCFYWNSLSDKEDRSVPKWTKPDLAEAVLKGYYGADYTLGGINDIPSALARPADNNIYDLQGKRVTQPMKGVYIRGGKKFVVK